MNALVELNALSKSFGDLAVIQGINGVLKAGEIISLVGPSGCGKSTLLRLIAGSVLPTSGQIRTHVETEEIGFVFQDVRLLPWKSALENIIFVLHNKPITPEQRISRAKQALARVGLSNFEHYLPSQLSGGMQKRIAIARALAIDPKLLLFDEPFSDLDLPLRMLLIEDIRHLLKDGRKTVVYVTHDIREALTLSDRICLLSARPTQVLEVIDLKNQGTKREIDFHSLETRMFSLLQAETKKQFDY
jgi:NitT/TauT family transport system ATP-binding protein